MSSSATIFFIFCYCDICHVRQGVNETSDDKTLTNHFISDFTKSFSVISSELSQPTRLTKQCKINWKKCQVCTLYWWPIPAHNMLKRLYLARQWWEAEKLAKVLPAKHKIQEVQGEHFNTLFIPVMQSSLEERSHNGSNQELWNIHSVSDLRGGTSIPM